jgi:hypothetical protein
METSSDIDKDDTTVHLNLIRGHYGGEGGKAHLLMPLAALGEVLVVG